MRVMAIINVTPDSFYAHSRNETHEMAIKRALMCIEEGADILDVGGESTRPGADEVSVAEELQRVIPVIQALKGCGKVISIDTKKAAVAEQALLHGATFINDVSGFREKEMRALVTHSGATCCVMHMQKTPKDMQENPFYEHGVLRDVKEWLSSQAHILLEEGVKPHQIILDPGIGFGKSVQDNFTLVSHARDLKTLEFPLLYGISRKSFLRKFLQKPTEELLPATAALHAYLIMQGVDILRVHDVAALQEIRTLYSLL